MTADQIDTLFSEIGWSLEKKVDGGITTWQLAIQLDRESRHVTVMFPTKRGNLLVACQLLSPQLNGKDLDLIPVQTLRTLIRLQTAGTGASVMSLSDGTHVVSWIHPGPVITAPLLKLLVLETATLAEQIDSALE